MPSSTHLTADELIILCQRTFPERADLRIESVLPINSRQHEVVAFQLRWSTGQGERSEAFIARRYISTISWWRPDDHGKAQREVTVTRWLRGHGFPVPEVYTREIGIRGDVALFSMLPGHDWSVYQQAFNVVIRPLVGEFARLLAWLHSLSPPEPVSRVVPSIQLPTAMANLAALAYQIDQPELTSSVEQIMVHAFNTPETQPVLLHGDYHFSNALLREGRIMGIVDWEYSAIGDPRWDIANIYMQLVDFDAADAAETFLETYLLNSGRRFEKAPVFNTIVPLQQWAISEWLVQQVEKGRPLSFALAHDLIAQRDIHRRRANLALHWLDG